MYLLDTHTLLWFLRDSPQLSKKALEIILAVLRYAQMAPILEDRKKIKSPHSVFKFFQEIFPKTEQFHYLKAYSNFYRLAP